MTLPLRNSRIKLSQGQLFWREVGQEGPTLVFLHGSWSNSSQWVPAIERLSGDYHCFAPDLLGFGESERANVHYSIQLEVECLEEFLESLNERSIYLVGHSVGAWVAASYALAHVDRVRGLVLLAPEGVEAEGLANRWKWTKYWMKLMPLVQRMRRSLFWIAKRVGLQRRLQLSIQKHELLDRSAVACQLLFQRPQPEIQAELLHERLGWLKAPVLILHPEQDTATSALSQAYAKLCPSVDLRVIPQAGTEVPEVLPDVVVQQIRDFVRRVEMEPR